MSAPSRIRIRMHHGVLIGIMVVFAFRVPSSVWVITTHQRSYRYVEEDRISNHATKRDCSRAHNDSNNNSDVHHSDFVYLPLLDWEIESMVDRTCRPKNDYGMNTNTNTRQDKIPSYCCVGGTSSGGGVDFSKENCDKGIETYNRTEFLALQELEKHPIVQHECLSNTVIQCDVCRIIDILIENSWKFAFQGDSLTRQTAIGMECELRRRGYIVETQTVDVSSKRPFWRVGLGSIVELRVTKVYNDRNWDQNNSAIVRLYDMYKPELHANDQAELRSIIENNDIIIFDHGLHYGAFSDSSFVEQMTALLQAFVKYGEHLQLLAWRETTAQHFNTSGGYWANDGDVKCAPINEEDVSGDNRLMDMMNEVLYNGNNSNIAAKLTILPFREYTSQFYDLHTDGDCTHFCSSPSLWLPLWRSIRNAMENIFVD